MNVIKKLVVLSTLSMVFGQKICPSDNLPLTNTYKSNYTASGELSYLYKCPNNHLVWIQIEPSYAKDNKDTQGSTNPSLYIDSPSIDSQSQSNSNQYFNFGDTILNQANAQASLNQQELYLFSTMTEEQKRRYLEAKQRQYEREDRMFKYCIYTAAIMIGVAYLIEESGCESRLCTFFGT